MIDFENIDFSTVDNDDLKNAMQIGKIHTIAQTSNTDKKTEVIVYMETPVYWVVLSKTTSNTCTIIKYTEIKNTKESNTTQGFKQVAEITTSGEDDEFTIGNLIISAKKDRLDDISVSLENVDANQLFLAVNTTSPEFKIMYKQTVEDGFKYLDCLDGSHCEPDTNHFFVPVKADFIANNKFFFRQVK